MISDFSNRAGDFATSFITALGERVCCVYDDGELFIENIGGDQFVTVFSGTSFSAPQVAGAVALLAQAFPNLTGQEIVEILLSTASDAGPNGTDDVYGTGILNITEAFEPQGTTTLAGTQTALVVGDDFAVGSPVTGDALTTASLSTIYTDKYDRAYVLDLGQNTRNSAQVQRLRAAVSRAGYSRSSAGEALSLAVTVADGERAGGVGWTQELQLNSEDAQGARVLAARIAANISPDTQVGFAISQSASGLVAQLQDAERPAFLVAPEAGRDTGFIASSDLAFATRHEIGSWGLTLSGERGHAWLGENRRASDVLFGVRERRRTSSFSLAADRSWGGLDANVALSWLSEQETLLGAHFNPVFGLQGADTLFLDGRLGQRIGTNWRIGAAYRAGFTRPRGSALVGDGSQVSTQGWSFDAVRFGTLTRGDSLGVRVSQPLRVTGGAVHFDLPVAYDYTTESPILGRQSLSLAPQGREIMSELNWSAPVGPAWVSTSVYYRSEPGHFADAPDDMGALLSLIARF
jgi:hypothetical protein